MQTEKIYSINEAWASKSVQLSVNVFYFDLERSDKQITKLVLKYLIQKTHLKK